MFLISATKRFQSFIHSFQLVASINVYVLEGILHGLSRGKLTIIFEVKM